MDAFHHVLVGVDLDGGNASGILARACQLADADEIEVVHVCDHLHKRFETYGSGGIPDSAELDRLVIADAESRLEEICASFGITHHKVLGGNVADAMHAYAEGAADLVVVGSHGRHGVQTLFGSRSNAVIHGTPCDVLAVHISDTDEPANAYKHVLVAVDLSQESDFLMSHALRIAETSNATMSVCHTYSSTSEVLRVAEEHNLEALGIKHGIPADRLHSLKGNPSRGIHKLATTIDADLVVVGTHGKHGLALLKGSTANAVLHGSSYDELAVRVGERQAA